MDHNAYVFFPTTADMESSTLSQFLTALAVSSAGAILLAALVAPPDPFTQLFYPLPLLLVALVCSSLWTYTAVFDSLERRV